MNKLTITAHTGCNQTRMNSLESIRSAICSNADIVEFDLQFTQSAVPVLSHDKPKQNNTYITLEEAFALLSAHHGIKINIDIKSTEHLSLIPPLIEKYALSDRAFFTGVTQSFLPDIIKQAPNVPRYLNIYPNPAALISKKYIASLIELTESSGCIGANVNFMLCSKQTVSLFHSAGLLVSIWTANTARQMKYTLSMHPDNITTKNVFLLKQLISSHN